MPILHQRMTGEAQLRLFTGAFADQPSLWGRGALMCRISTLLPMERHGRIARIIRRGRCGLGFLLETLLARPGLDQRAIDREMLVGQQPFVTRHSHDCVEKSLSPGMGQQPLTILAERAVLKTRLIQAHIQKPSKEEVGVQSLAREPATSY